MIQYKVLSSEAKASSLDPDGFLSIRCQVCVPRYGGLMRLILEEIQCSSYYIHLGMIKMHHDLKQLNWWGGMKKDVVDFGARSLCYPQVKAEH